MASRDRGSSQGGSPQPPWHRRRMCTVCRGAELARPGLAQEFEVKRVGEAPLPRSSEESMRELMPRAGLTLCWGLDMLRTRMVLQEPGKSCAGMSHLPRAVFHLSFK